MSAARKAQPELVTLTQAARQCGVSRSRLRRALDEGLLPNAVRAYDDRGTWTVPVSDLVDAGYLDSTEQVVNSPQSGHGQVAEQVTPDPEQVGPGVGLVRWEDVQGLVGQLVSAHDDRARAETELRVATFQLEQAQAETDRLRAQLAAQETAGNQQAARGWWKRSG